MTETCINPAEIELGDLLAYAEGEPAPKIKAHVQACTFCAKKVADYQALNGLLTARFYRYHCPEPQMLADFSFDLLNKRDKQNVATHLKTCPHCQQTLAELNSLSNNPLDVVQSHMGQVKEWLLAKLIPPPQPALALRGTARPGGQRYQVEGLDVTLNQQKQGQSIRLHGRLHSAGPLNETASITMLLLQNQHPLAEQKTNAVGGFAFAGVAPGLYELAFGWQGQGIIIPEIEVLK